MPRQFSTIYTIAFSTAVCIICSLVVSTLAVGLKDRQERNAALDLRKNVLLASGLIKPTDGVSRDQIEELFKQIEIAVVNLETGEYATDIDPATYDQYEALKDPTLSRDAPPNRAGLKKLPKYARVYKVMNDGKLEQIVLPISGKGLWSTLYGFLSLDRDTTTVRGITFYAHAETPGLGGEIDNPKWKGLWVGRQAFDESWDVEIQVLKGTAGSVKEDPHHVDGISGATITSKGVGHLVAFWIGEHGLGPYLENLREKTE